MFSRKERNAWAISLDIASEIGRRGFLAAVRTVTVISAAGNVRRPGIVIPGRGVAAIDNDSSIIVASYNKLLSRGATFEYKGADDAAENILRRLPLP